MSLLKLAITNYDVMSRRMQRLRSDPSESIAHLMTRDHAPLTQLENNKVTHRINSLVRNGVFGQQAGKLKTIDPAKVVERFEKIFKK